MKSRQCIVRHFVLVFTFTNVRLSGVTSLHRGSHIRAHVLLNLLNELGKRDECKAYRAFNLFFAANLINSIKQEHDLSYDIVITLKLHIWRKTSYFFHYLRNVVIIDVIKFPIYQ